MTRQVFTSMMTPPKDPTTPLIYLAGPIQGARDWQREATKILEDLAPDVDVANPRCAKFNGIAEAQLQFEMRFMERAAQSGVILFMLVPETQHRCGRAYGAQTRFELGEWVTKSEAGLARVVVGIERGFAGGPYLQRRITLSSPRVPICRTIRQACAVAAELVHDESPIVVYPRALSELFVPQPFGGKNNG